MSAAIYLGRAQRDTLVIDSGHSMAKWEPIVENYLGFADGVAGEQLLKNGRRQAKRHEVVFANDEIKSVSSGKSHFVLKGKKKTYRTKRLLLATGIFHLPPEIPGVKRMPRPQHVFSARTATAIACAENGSQSSARTTKRSSTRSACSITRPA